MTIQTKIAVLFASLTAGLLLAAGALLYYRINTNTFEDFYKRLEIRAVVAAKAAQHANTSYSQLYKELRAQHLDPLPGEREQVLDPGAADRSLPGNPLLPPPDAIRTALRDGRSTARHGNRFFYLLRYPQGHTPMLLVISAHNEQSLQYLHDLRRALFLFFPGAVLLAFTIGILFSKSILKPIRNITANVRNLSAHNLHLRLAPKPGTDEIAELAGTFNTMLDRLETAFETQNNFVSHASHEFNTPLTAIIGEAEYALARPRTSEQYVHSIQNMLAAAEKLSGITQSLLQLAQAGMTGAPQELTLLRVDELLRKVRATTDGIMPDNNVILNASLVPADREKLTIRGNATLLELAITNVVLNACKYSSNKPVQLAVAATHSHVIVLVQDQGIGVPQDELRYLFDPFFRASNAKNFNGYGIGLPLTRTIIRLHQGELQVRSEEHVGTEIQITLPRATAD